MWKQFRRESYEVQVEEIEALRSDARNLWDSHSGFDSRLDSVLNRAMTDPNPNPRRLRGKIDRILRKHSLKLVDGELIVETPRLPLWRPFCLESPAVRGDERDTLDRYIRSRMDYFGELDGDFDSVLDCAQRHIYSSNPRKLRKIIDRGFRKYFEAPAETV
jgi:hypothetical protein